MTAPNGFKKSFSLILALLPLTVLLSTAWAAHAAAKIAVVPKWERFEATFKSRTQYTNAFQQATLSVNFVSPNGETNTVPGFWDGGRTWRARFSPGTPGRWTYVTTCSDTANAGLHAQTGDFLCGAAKNQTRFGQHGPIQISRDRRYL